MEQKNRYFKNINEEIQQEKRRLHRNRIIRRVVSLVLVIALVSYNVLTDNSLLRLISAQEPDGTENAPQQEITEVTPTEKPASPEAPEEPHVPTQAPVEENKATSEPAAKDEGTHADATSSPEAEPLPVLTAEPESETEEEQEQERTPLQQEVERFGGAYVKVSDGAEMYADSALRGEWFARFDGGLAYVDAIDTGWSTAHVVYYEKDRTVQSAWMSLSQVSLAEREKTIEELDKLKNTSKVSELNGLLLPAVNIAHRQQQQDTSAAEPLYQSVIVLQDDDNIRLRSQPTQDSYVIARVSRGASVAVLAECGEWNLVRDSKGNVGYIRAQYMSRSAEAAPTAEPSAEPTEEATAEPSVEPTEEATAEPSVEPTEEATAEPSAEPTEEATVEPAAEPTPVPAQLPQDWYFVAPAKLAWGLSMVEATVEDAEGSVYPQTIYTYQLAEDSEPLYAVYGSVGAEGEPNYYVCDSQGVLAQPYQLAQLPEEPLPTQQPLQVEWRALEPEALPDGYEIQMVEDAADSENLKTVYAYFDTETGNVCYAVYGEADGQEGFFACDETGALIVPVVLVSAPVSPEEGPAVKKLTDEATGVSITFTRAALPEGLTMDDVAIRVTTLTQDQIDAYRQQMGIAEDTPIVSALDVCLIDSRTGLEFQPLVPVNVQMSVTQDYEGEVTLYHAAETGDEKLTGETQQGVCEFTLSGFSPMLLALTNVQFTVTLNIVGLESMTDSTANSNFHNYTVYEVQRRLPGGEWNKLFNIFYLKNDTKWTYTNTLPVFDDTGIPYEYRCVRSISASNIKYLYRFEYAGPEELSLVNNVFTDTVYYHSTARKIEFTGKAPESLTKEQLQKLQIYTYRDYKYHTAETIEDLGDNTYRLIFAVSDGTVNFDYRFNQDGSYKIGFDWETMQLDDPDTVKISGTIYPSNQLVGFVYVKVPTEEDRQNEIKGLIKLYTTVTATLMRDGEPVEGVDPLVFDIANDPEDTEYKGYIRKQFVFQEPTQYGNETVKWTADVADVYFCIDSKTPSVRPDNMKYLNANVLQPLLDTTVIRLQPMMDYNDNKDSAGLRDVLKEKIVKLLADGEETGISLTVGSLYSNSSREVARLRRLAEDGHEIEYTMQAEDTSPYKLQISSYTERHSSGSYVDFTIKCSLPTDQTQSARATVYWTGDGINTAMEQNLRPSGVKLHLEYTTGSPDSEDSDWKPYWGSDFTVTPDSNGDWVYNWATLSKTDLEGNPIHYRVSPTAYPYYTVTAERKDTVQDDGTVTHTDFILTYTYNSDWNYAVKLEWTGAEKTDVKFVTTSYRDVAQQQFKLSVSTQKEYDVGQLSIELPYIAAEGREGRKTQFLLGELGIGPASKPSEDKSFTYEVLKDRNVVRIYNYKPLSGGYNFNVEGLYISADQTQSDLTQNKVYKQNTPGLLDFTKLDITAKGTGQYQGQAEPEKIESQHITYLLDTGLSSLYFQTPSSDETVEEPVYYWPSDYGEKPDDFDQYNWVLYTVRPRLSANQKSEMTMTLTPGQGGKIYSIMPSKYTNNMKDPVYHEDGSAEVSFDMEPSGDSGFSLVLVKYPKVQGSVYYTLDRSAKAVGSDQHEDHLTSKDKNDILQTSKSQQGYFWEEYTAPVGTIISKKHTGGSAYDPDGYLDYLDYGRDVSPTSSFRTHFELNGRVVSNAQYAKLELLDDAVYANVKIDGKYLGYELLSLDDYYLSTYSVSLARVALPVDPNTGESLPADEESPLTATVWVQDSGTDWKAVETVPIQNGQTKFNLNPKGGRIKVTIDNGVKGEYSITLSVSVVIRGTSPKVKEWMQKGTIEEIRLINFGATKTYYKDADGSYQIVDRQASPYSVAMAVGLSDLDQLNPEYGGNPPRSSATAYYERSTISGAMTKENSGDPVVDMAKGLARQNFILEAKESMLNLGVENPVIQQDKGTFYDLLPLGWHLDKRAEIKVQNPNSSYMKGTVDSVKTISNYKQSGRDLVIFKVSLEDNVYGRTSSNLTSGFRLQFTAVASLEEINPYETVYNLSAYQRGDLEELHGNAVPDRGYGGYASDIWKANGEYIMADLNGTGISKINNTFYASKNFSVGFQRASQNGLVKRVTGSSGMQGLTDTVAPDETYSYQLKFETAETGTTSNVVIYDIMENAATGEQVNGWKGVYQSVDTSAAKAMGIDVTVWYSTKPLSYGDESTLLLENNPGAWSTSKPGDASKITAIAIDLRYKADKSDFVFPAKSKLEVDVYMKAPKQLNKQNPYAYNTAALHSTFKASSASDPDTKTVVGSATTLKLARLQDIVFTKQADADNGGLASITNAIFYLYQCSEGTGHTHTGKPGDKGSCWGDVIYRASSNSEGLVSFEELSSGTYAFVENSVPTGIQKSNAYWTFDVDAESGTHTAPIASDTGLALGLDTTKTKYALKNERIGFSIRITKNWQDGNDVSLRPKELTFDLYRNDETTPIQTKTVQVSGASNSQEFDKVFENLPCYDLKGNRITYRVVERPVPGYTAANDGYFTVTSSYATTQQGKITNVRNGTVQVEKKLVGSDAQTEFPFTLKLEDSKGNPIYEKADGEPYTFTLRKYIGENTYTEATVQPDSNGMISFTLTKDQKILLIDLPTGVKYTVAENLAQDMQYTVTSTGSVGFTTTNSIPKAVFTNTVKPCEIDLSAEKQIKSSITGGTYDVDNVPEFRFQLYRVENGQDVLVQTKSVQGEGTVGFDSFSVSAAGIYTYKVKEQVLTGDAYKNYTFDATEYTVTVVAVDRKGKLEGTVSYKVGQVDAAKVVFVNTFTPTPATLTLPVTKDISGDTPPSSATFEFTLAGVGSAPMPDEAGRKTSVTGKSTGHFGQISFTAPGTYTYFVRETRGTEDGYTYDTSNHTVVVTVTAAGSGLNVSYMVDGFAPDDDSKGIVITNAYLTPNSNVSLKKSANPSNQVREGEIITYTITATVANYQAKKVTFSDTLPEGISLVSGSMKLTTGVGTAAQTEIDVPDSSYTAADRTIHYTADALPVGNSTLTYRAVVEKLDAGVTQKTLKNVAVISGENIPTPVRTVDNIVNVAARYAQIRKSAALITGDTDGAGGTADAENDGSAAPVDTQLGQTVEYHIYVKNVSDAQLASGIIVVTDKVPDGTTYVSGSASDRGEEKNGTITWTLSNLRAGQEKMLTFRVKAPAAADPVTFTTLFTNQAEMADAEVAVRSWSETVTVIQPDGSTTVKTQGDTLYTETEVLKKSNTTRHEVKESKLDAVKISDKLTGGDVANMGQTLKVGDVITYTVTITNNGAAPAKNVAIQDEIPAGTQFVSGSASLNGSLCTDSDVLKAGKVRWTMAELQVGGKMTAQFKVKVVDAALGQDGHSPVTIANKALYGKDITDETVTPPSETNELKNPVVTYQKTLVPDASTVQEGDVLTYQIMVYASEATEEVFTLTDTIPDGLSVVADSMKVTLPDGIVENGAYTKPNVTWTAAKLQKGTTVFEIKAVVDKLKAPATRRELKNTAQLTNGDGQNWPVVEKTVDVISRRAQVHKTAALMKADGGMGGTAAGTASNPVPAALEQKIKYILTVTNTGDLAANEEDIIVTDTLPVDTEGQPLAVEEISHNGELSRDQKTITWKLPAMAAGESMELTFVATAPSSAGSSHLYVFSNTASLTDTAKENKKYTETVTTVDGKTYRTDESVYTEETEYTAASETTYHQVEDSELRVTKSADIPESQTLREGQKVTYTIGVTVNGAALQNQQIKDTLPEGMTLVESGITPKTYTLSADRRTVTWNVKTLTAGTHVFTLSAVVDKLPDGVTAKELKNTATVGAPGEDGKPSNEVSHTVQSRSATIAKNAQVQNADGVTYAAVDNGTSETPVLVQPGSVVKYTLIVTNQGGLASGTDDKAIVVTDRVPVGSTYVEGSASHNGTEANGTITWKLPSIPVGGKMEVSFLVTANEPIGSASEMVFINKAHLSDNDEKALVYEETVLDQNGQVLHTKNEKVYDSTAYELDSNPTYHKTLKGGLTLNKTSDPAGDVREGQIITYTITAHVTNWEVQGASIEDTLPAGVSLVKDSVKLILPNGRQQTLADAYTANTRLLKAENLTLPVGDTQLTYQVMVEKLPEGQTQLTLTNNALVKAPGMPESKTQTTNTVQSRYAEIRKMEALVTGDAAGMGGQLGVEADGRITPVDTLPGQTVEYHIYVRNVSGKLSSGIILVEDDLPAGTTYVPESITVGGISQQDADCKTGDHFTFTVNDLAPNQEILITFRVKAPTQVDPDTHTVQFTNQAQMTDQEVTAREWEETVTVIKPDGREETRTENGKIYTVEESKKPSNETRNEVRDAQLNGSKSSNQMLDNDPTKPGKSLKVGDEITYTVTISNNGAAAAKNVMLKDVIPTGTEYVAGSASLNGTPSSDLTVYNAANRTLTWMAGELAQGAAMVAQFRVTVVDAALGQDGRTPVTIANKAFFGKDITNQDTTPPQETNEVRNPVISYEKTMTPDQETVEEGDILTYQILVHASDATEDAVTVKDTLPDGLAVVTGSIKAIQPDGTETANAGSYAKPTVTWKAQKLQKGTTVFEVRTVVGKLEGSATSRDLKNTAQITTPGKTDWPLVEKTTTVKTRRAEVHKTASLLNENGQELGKAAGSAQNPVSAALGQKIKYILTVVNNGSLAAPDEAIVVTDTVPVDVNGDPLSVEQISNGGVLSGDGKTITWKLSAMEANETEELSFVAAAPVSAGETHAYVFSNTAALKDTVKEEKTYTETVTTTDGQTYSTGDKVYTNPTDYTASSETTYHKVEDSAIQISKTANVADNMAVREGDLITYTIHVTVNGATAKNLQVSDALPDGLALVQGSMQPATGVFADGKITWPAADLAAGTYTYSFSAVVEKLPDGETSKVIRNTAVVGEPGSPDPKQSNTVEHTVKKRTATAEKEARVKQADGAYPTAASNGTLAAPVSVKPGDTIQYTLVITNQGDLTAKDGTIVVTDRVPAGSTYVAGSASHGGVEANGTITWTLSSMDVGEVRRLTFEVTANALADPAQPALIQNTAHIKDQDVQQLTYSETIVDRDGNTHRKGDSVYSAVDSERDFGETYHQVTEPLMQVVKSVTMDGRDMNGKLVKPGDRLTYTLTVQNKGSRDVVNQLVRDYVPEGTTLVAGTVTGGTANRVREDHIDWTVAVSAGGTETLTFQVDVDQLQGAAKLIENKALYTAKPADPTPDTPPTPEDPDPETPTNEVTNPTLIYEKTASPAGAVDEGEAITYTITVQAPKGGVSDVTVTDPLPQGVSFVPGSIRMKLGTQPEQILNDGQYDVNSRTVTWTANLPEGTSRFSVTVIANKLGNDENGAPVLEKTIRNNAVLKTPETDYPGVESNETTVRSRYALLEKDASLIVEPRVWEKGTENDPIDVELEQVIEYRLTVTNYGDQPSGALTLVDTVPEGCTLIQGSVTGMNTVSGNTITWTLSGVKTGEPVSVTFQVKAPVDAQLGTDGIYKFRNVAKLTDVEKTETRYDRSWVDEKGKTHTDTEFVYTEEETTKTSNETWHQVKQPRAAFTKESNPNGDVREGDIITYTLRAQVEVTVMKDVTFVDTMPEGVTLLTDTIQLDGRALTTQDYTYADRVLTVTASTLDVGEHTVTFQAVVNRLAENETEKSINNSAILRRPGQPDEPTNTVFNTVKTRWSEITKSAALVQNGQLTAENAGKENTPVQTYPEQVVEYILRVTNRSAEKLGQQPMQSGEIEVTDQLPEGTTYVDGSMTAVGGKVTASAYADGTFTWKLQGLTKDETVELRFRVKAPAVDQLVNNEKKFENQADLTDVEKTQTEYQKTFTDEKGVTHQQGDKVYTEQEQKKQSNKTYHITRNASVTAVKVSDRMLGASTDYPSAGKSVRVGDNITYRVRVTNSGATAAYNVTVCDYVPDNTNLVTAVNSKAYDADSRRVTWVIDEIQPGETKEVTMTVKVEAVETAGELSSILNTAYYDQGTPETDDQPNDPDDPDHPLDPEDPEKPWTPTNELENPTVRYQKTSDAGQTVQEGQVIHYTLTVEASSKVSETYTLTDTLPAGVTLITEGMTLPQTAAYTYAAPVLTFTATALEEGKNEFTYAVVVDKLAKDQMQLVLKNEAVLKDPEGKPFTSESTTSTVKRRYVTIQKDAQLVKEDGSLEPVANGAEGAPVATLNEQVIQYTLTVTNLSAPGLTSGEIVVTDAIPAELEYVSGSMQNAVFSGNGTQVSMNVFTGAPTWTLTGMSPNETAKLTFRAKVKKLSAGVTVDILNQASAKDSELEEIEYKTTVKDGEGNVIHQTGEKVYESTEITKESNKTYHQAKEPKMNFVKSALVKDGNGWKVLPADESVREGQVVRYLMTVTVENTQTTGMAVVFDKLPQGITPITSSIQYQLAGGTVQKDTVGYDHVQRTIIWPTLDLPVGESQFWFDATVDALPEGVYNRKLTNTATMTRPGEPGIPSNQVEVTVKKRSATIEKSAQVNGVTDNGEENRYVQTPRNTVVTYTLKVTNVGELAAKAGDIVVTDRVPKGTGYVADSADNGGVYDAQTQTITWTLPQMAAGEVKEISFQVKTPAKLENAAQALRFINQAHMSDLDQKNLTYEETTYDENGAPIHKANEKVYQESAYELDTNKTYHEVKEPRIEVVKEVSVASGKLVKPGQTLTYTLTVKNTGSQDANKQLIRDYVPEGTTFAGHIVGGGTQYTNAKGDYVDWIVDIPADGTELQLSFDVTVNALNGAAKLIVNSALFTKTPENPDPEKEPTKDDPDPQDHTNEVNNPTIVVLKSADPADGSILNEGDVVEYTITVKTPDDAKFTSLPQTTVTDELPSGMALVKGSIQYKLAGEQTTQVADSAYAGGTITWPVVTLPKGDSTFTFKAMVEKLPEGVYEAAFRNQALVKTPEQENTPETSTVVEHIVRTRKAEIEKSLALIEGEDANGLNGTAGAEQTGVPDPVYTRRGQVIEYRLTVKNTGADGIYSGDITVTDPLPNATTFITGSMTCQFVETATGTAMDGSQAMVKAQGTKDNGVYWTLSKLLSGEEAHLTFRVYAPLTADDPATPEVEKVLLLTNQAKLNDKQLSEKVYQETVTTVDAHGNVTTITKNDHVYEEREYEKDSNKTQNVVHEPAVTVVKTSDPASPTADGLSPVVKPGDTITYTLTVTNTGAEEARNLTVRDYIPEGTDYVPGSANPAVTPQTVAIGTAIKERLEWKLDSVPVNGTVTLTFQVKVKEEGKSGTIRNAALYYLPENPDKPAPEDPKDPDKEYTPTNEVTHQTAQFVKLASPMGGSTAGDAIKVQPGQAITYTLQLDANEAMANVNVTDRVPEGLTLVPDSIRVLLPNGVEQQVPDDAYNADTRTITWPAQHITAGQTGFSFQVVVDKLPEGEVTKLYDNQGVLTLDKGDGTQETLTTNHVTHKANEGTVTIRKEASLVENNVLLPTANGTQVSPVEADRGQTVEYRLIVKRTGARENESGDIVVTDALPDGTELIPGTIRSNITSAYGDVNGTVKSQEVKSVTDIHGYDKTGIEWVLTGMKDGETAILTFRVTAPTTVPEGKSLTFENTASLIDKEKTTPVYEVSVPGHPAGSEVYTPDECKKTSETTYHVVRGAKLNAQKSSDPASGDRVFDNQVIKYQITVTNTGEGSAKNVIIRDALPQYTNFVTATLDVQGSLRQLTIDGKKYVTALIDEIAPGGSVTMTMTVRVKMMPVVGERIIRNTAQVKEAKIGEDPWDDAMDHHGYSDTNEIIHFQSKDPSQIPQTGDLPSKLPFVAGGIGLAMLLIVLIIRRKQRKEEKN